MAKMIYYPSFEVYDEKWLKFALLYHKEINPIIPESAKHSLSDTFNEIVKETDFIKPYSPTPDEGNRATHRAIDTVTTLLSNASYHASFFETNNISMEWRNTNTHNYEIYSEKYSKDWITFCKEYGFGKESANGIKINRDLAFVYMSMLANDIADGRNISTITNIQKYDKFLRYRYSNRDLSDNKNFVANRVINFLLPQNLEEITFDRIIKLRKSDGFIQKQSAFHGSLEKYIDNTTNDLSAADFLDSLQEGGMSDFFRILIENKFNLIAIPVLVWSAYESQSLEIFSALATAETFRNSIMDTRRKQPGRLSNKYVADLKNI